jgi:beta-mannosidase
MARTRLKLHDGWMLLLDAHTRAALGTDATEIAAAVPGSVHSDLLAAKLIADPMLERNVATQQWIGESDWAYRLRFDAEAAGDGERVDLVFDGLDTIASVVLNGTKLGRTKNGHCRYRFDVGAVLHTEGNELEVLFDSPRTVATTSGIWRPVALERWRGARLATVRPSAVVDSPSPHDGESGRVDVAIEIERATAPHHAAGDVQIDAVLTGPDGHVVGACSPPFGGDSVLLSVTAATVRRWWPAGRGDQVLYRLDVFLTIDGVVADRTSQRVGFRHVELDTTPEPDGGARFAFVVNGERVGIRGFNWIHDDCFPSGLTRERVRARIDQALAANANLIRVWDGGIYESDDLYECCDERGVLVFQDFSSACAAYPDERLAAEINAEVIDNMNRLMSHSSLLVWNGNDDCLQGWHDWDLQEVLGDRPWDEHFHRELLPNVTSSLDPAGPSPSTITTS